MVRGLAYSGNRMQAITDISDSDNTAYLRERFLMAKTRADEIKCWVGFIITFFGGSGQRQIRNPDSPKNYGDTLRAPLFLIGELLFHYLIVKRHGCVVSAFPFYAFLTVINAFKDYLGLMSSRCYPHTHFRG